MSLPSTAAGARAVDVTFDSAVFSLDAIKKAAYTLSARASFDIRVTGKEVHCTVQLDSSATHEEAESFVRDFRTEVLD